jgi:hypothetical protein
MSSYLSAVGLQQSLVTPDTHEFPWGGWSPATDRM